MSKEKADFTVVAGDEGHSTTGGSNGENGDTSGPAVSRKPSTSAKKTGGKQSDANSKGGKDGGMVLWGAEAQVRSGGDLGPLKLSDLDGIPGVIEPCSARLYSVNLDTTLGNPIWAGDEPL